MIFTGQYEHTIDAKNRLAIPAEIRARWSPEHDGDAWQALPWVGGVIRLYTETTFRQAADTGSLTLTPDEDEAELEVTLFGMAARLEADSAGRIKLPEDMLKLVGLPREVVLVGARDRLEIRDRAAWTGEQAERLNKLPELMRRIKEKAVPNGG